MRKKVIAGVIGFGVLAAVATASLNLVDTTQSGSNTEPVVMGSNSPAQSYIDQGKFYLVQHNMLAARDQFKQAVQAEPSNQEANLLYGVTRVFAVAEDGQSLHTSELDSVREIFELTGFVFSKFSVYDTTYSAPEELAATTPRTGAALDFLKSKLLPEVDNAITNLNAVSATTFTSVIDPSSINKNSGSVITIDYADALVIRALLQAIKCNLELLMVYGLDASLPNIQDAPDQLMTYKQLLQDSTFLTPKDSTRLTTAKTALISFIDTYTAAVPYLKNRPDTVHNLFVIDVPVSRNSGGSGSSGFTYSKLDEITNNLAGIKNSLNGQVYSLPIKSEKDGDRFIDLSKFFNGASPINFRAQLANCSTPKALSDPTIGGLFPLGLSIAQDPSLPFINRHLLGVACTGMETPWVKIEPEWLDLYDTSYFMSGPRSFSISNHGTSNLQVSSINTVGLNSSQFSIAPGNCATLAPGASCTQTVSLQSPYPYGTLFADIQVTSNDLSSPRSFVELRGTTSSTTPNPGPPSQYELTTTIIGSGSGSVSFSGHSIFGGFSGACPPACSGFPPNGASFELRPLPSPGSLFTGWSGCDSVDGDTCHLKMYSPKSITATFNSEPGSLTVMASPPGGSYSGPQTIALAASRDSAMYYTLDNSTPTSSSLPYYGPFTISTPATLKYIAIPFSGSATAVKTETYTGWLLSPTLSVSVTGNGGGTINSIYPASGLITCSSPHQASDICTTTITSERDVKLIASPDSASLFTGWSLSTCPGTGPCMVTLSLDTAITGTFSKMPPIKVVSTGYPSTYHTIFSDAFMNARENSIIQLQETLFEESLLFNTPFPISIMGGFDAGFTSQNGFSTLPGLTISSGSSTIDRLIVK